MTIDPQTLLVAILTAVGGYLVAKSTAGKIDAEGTAISVKSFRELSNQVVELQKQMSEIREESIRKDQLIGQLRDRVHELEREISTLRPGAK
jgi:cell division protein FtsB